jgi:sigma-B regulation protein RsbU (phosphoserine phosphatase)
MGTMENKTMKKNRKHVGLAFKFIIGLIIVGIAIMAASVFVGKDAYWNSIMKQYNTVVYQISDTAKNYVTDEDWKTYADVAYRYCHGNATDEEIQKIVQSETYRQTKERLDKLRESMDANDIFLFVFDMDILNNFDETAYENKEWKPMCYISDSYMDIDLQFAMGDSGSMSPQYREECIRSCESGTVSDTYFVSKSDFGYNIASMYPVVIDGNTVACVGVEIPMRTLESEVRTYVIRTIAVGSIVTIVLLLIAILFLIKTMIRPIKLVADEAAYFVENNNTLSKKLANIRTKDEIQTLSENLMKMETDINDYIENLKAVTAEKERIGAELSVATNIQASMLPCIFPAFQDRDEFEIYASMNPAKEVGGDFYDFFLVDDDHLGLVIADVSGKGVPAALFMVISKTLLKNRALMKTSPKEILESVNNQLCENNEAEMFVTVWLGIYEISTGKLTAANAGHEYPAIRREGGEFELYKDKHGFVLAGMENAKYHEYELELNAGDTLFVYTDGVTEATNANEELYGTDRMLAALNQNPGRRPPQLLPDVKADIDSFAGEAPQFDDITMLSLKINKI